MRTDDSGSGSGSSVLSDETLTPSWVDGVPKELTELDRRLRVLSEGLRVLERLVGVTRQATQALRGVDAAAAIAKQATCEDVPVSI